MFKPFFGNNYPNQSLISFNIVLITLLYFKILANTKKYNGKICLTYF